MKLISMTDFVLEQKRFVKPISNNRLFGCEKFFERVENYATFLKQPLKLEMFVPCDEDGNVLNEPKDWKTYESGGSAFMNIDEILPCQDYKKAKEKVLFEGLTNFGEYIINSMGAMYLKKEQFNTGFIIENKCIGLQLTESAIKQIQP